VGLDVVESAVEQAVEQYMCGRNPAMVQNLKFVCRPRWRCASQVVVKENIATASMWRYRRNSGEHNNQWRRSVSWKGEELPLVNLGDLIASGDGESSRVNGVECAHLQSHRWTVLRIFVTSFRDRCDAIEGTQEVLMRSLGSHAARGPGRRRCGITRW